MAQRCVTPERNQTETSFSPLLLALLLLLYGAGMLALPIYFFGLTVGLWLSATVLCGGVGVVVVLAGANRVQQAPQQPAPQPCVIRATPRAVQNWVPPRIVPYQ